MSLELVSRLTLALARAGATEGVRTHPLISQMRMQRTGGGFKVTPPAHGSPKIKGISAWGTQPSGTVRGFFPTSWPICSPVPAAPAPQLPPRSISQCGNPSGLSLWAPLSVFALPGIPLHSLAPESAARWHHCSAGLAVLSQS